MCEDEKKMKKGHGRVRKRGGREGQSKKRRGGVGKSGLSVSVVQAVGDGNLGKRTGQERHTRRTRSSSIYLVPLSVLGGPLAASP